MMLERDKGAQYQRGMSLIELMIGLVVGLVILLGIVQTMMVSKSASMSRQSMSAIAENARFAFEFMSRDMRMAGYEHECTAGTGDAITLVDEVLMVCYQDSNGNDVSASYSLNDAGELIYRRVVAGVVAINSEILIDRVRQFDLLFGERTSDGNIQYITTVPATPDELISIRVTLSIGDPTDGRTLQVANNTITMTIALRNQIIQIMNGT